jgi:hypothetical protein
MNLLKIKYLKLEELSYPLKIPRIKRNPARKPGSFSTAVTLEEKYSPNVDSI